MCGYVSAPDMHYILFDAAFFFITEWRKNKTHSP